MREPYFIGPNATVRLASRKDFEDFGLSFEGYDDPMYEFDTTLSHNRRTSKQINYKPLNSSALWKTSFRPKKTSYRWPWPTFSPVPTTRRKRFDEAALAELAASIRRQGVLQPIGVRPVADTGRFEIIFGERRYRASLMAEQAEIPAIVLDVSDEEAQEMAVTENLQREDVSPMEEANAYQKLIENGRHDVPSLAVQFGKSENYIRTRLKFLSLIPEIADSWRRTS